MLLPEVNKVYSHFDDGKIHEGRRENVLIEEVLSFDEIDKETLEHWKEEVEAADWIYAKETDFFVKASLIGADDKLVYVRCKPEGWFSLGYLNAGRLDIDGKLRSSYE